MPVPKVVSKALRTWHWALLYITDTVKTIIKIGIVKNNNSRQ